MKGGFHMSNSSLWIIIAMLVIIVAVLVYNSTWYMAATAPPQQKKANGPSMKGPEGFAEKICPIDGKLVIAGTCKNSSDDGTGFGILNSGSLQNRRGPMWM
jgi:hypothetical protein